jgi:hypothetical protein
MEEGLNHLASEMFRKFARFEYALKATGFHQGRDGPARVPLQPATWAFMQARGASYVASAELFASSL